MKYIKIVNDGELDIRLVALMGGTTKANDRYKIGQFGTGLKYTLAYLYRKNIDFKVYVGEQQVEIGLDTEEIRGEKFDIIKINGQRTSITTKMGEDWKAWMIIRELWCNALDEGGATKEEVTEGITGEIGKTVFYIQMTSDIQEVIDQWDKYFIPQGLEPIYKSEQYILYPAGEHMCIYKNGVLIKEQPKSKTVFRYDILNADINELREYKSAPSMDISNAIKQMDAPAIEYFLQNLTVDHYEGNNMDYNWYTHWGTGWQAMMIGTRMITESVQKRYDDYGYSYSKEDYTVIPECLYNSLVKEYGPGGLEAKDSAYSFYAIEDVQAEEKIQSCVNQLKEIGYELDERLKWQVGLFQNEDESIKVEPRDNKLLIAAETTKKSPEELIELLVDKGEWYRIQKQGKDNLKKHLVKLYIEQLRNSVGITTSPDTENLQEMVKLQFTLTMPNVGSWDGKWSGEGKLYAKIRHVSRKRAQELLGEQKSNSWYYGWTDGWGANINAKLVTDKEAQETSWKSQGFCGYEWMIDSIVAHNEILTRAERKGMPVEEVVVTQQEADNTMSDELPF